MIYAPVQSTRVHNLFVSALLWIATAFAATQPGFAESTESGYYTTDCYTDNCCCPIRRLRRGTAPGRDLADQHPLPGLSDVRLAGSGCVPVHRKTASGNRPTCRPASPTPTPRRVPLFGYTAIRLTPGEPGNEGWGFIASWSPSRILDRLRFVIWSWPSDKIKGPLNDIRTKAWRTDTDGYYLGWFLQRMHPQSDIGLIGFSYGARIVSGALHVLAGGELDGMGSADARRDGPPSAACCFVCSGSPRLLALAWCVPWTRVAAG